MKKWKCTVCGYIHTGDEPPEKCPVCGADSSRFVLLEEAGAPAETPIPKAPSRHVEQVRPAVAQPADTRKPPVVTRVGLAERIGPVLTRLHAHPVAVHIPNGVLPVGLAFLFGGALLDCGPLVKAGFYNLVVVLLAMPVVLLTGYNDWQQRYGGKLTNLFVAKIACGAIVSAGCLAMVVWLLARPELLLSVSISRRVFVFFAMVTLAAAVMAGYYGGKLVFFYQEKKD